MALMGEDGRGYELARKLEGCGVWRSWLGESSYTNFAHFLTSPSTWEAFMRTDDSKTRVQIQLQLRVRALLYDKASVSLFLRSHLSSSFSSPSSSSSSSSSSAASSSSSSSSSSSTAAASPSKLNPFYLQLHGDDVYFCLEDHSRNRGVQLPEGSAPSNSVQSSKIQSKLAFGVGSRYVEPGVDNISEKPGHDDLPESWYNQFIKKYRDSRQNILPFGDQESHKRSPEGMSTYLRLLEKHKRQRQAFKEDQSVGFGNPIWENGSNMHSVSVSDGNSSMDDETFFPETMFSLNCVPDSALPPISRAEDNKKIEFYGVLDCLPHVVTRSPAMMERFGIRPDYLGTGFERSKYRGKNGLELNRKPLGQEQALRMSQKVIARVLVTLGFEGATEVSVEVLSQFLNCHICKLGRTLKVITDSYRKQWSAIEILKMFLQTSGYSDLGALAEYAKEGNRTFTQQTPQNLRGLQSGFQSQHQSPNLQPQQFPRQMHPHMQMQIMHPQNLAFQQQQQWERMRRRQPSTPRSGMSMDKERPLMEVKIENATESPFDGNSSIVNGRHPQMQFRQQQLGGMANLPAQSSHQFKQLASGQIPQIQTQNMVMARPPPVKVEGFQELMGGDASLKHDSEEHKLTSPSK
ncbi:uncharacterized protein LOC122659640 [Telopea speciosissima]|uniref:uncharacterized protein LOC122659640 n=1 Tax=Telopea speciosissima TaxID=54955 RepID=UPI001CC33BE9|nr:uncharacterized protein LOC122659640 [Telopea speciosissima]